MRPIVKILPCTVAKSAKAALRAERLDAVADRGYFNSEEILACAQPGITVTLPKPPMPTAIWTGVMPSLSP
jgi:hypothetical protein